ncbi:hypothetical protein [Blastococcus sp. SYSU DS1021]
MTGRGARDVRSEPWFLAVASLLLVGAAAFLIRDLLAGDTSAFDIAVRAATVAGWLVLLVTGVVGRRHERGDRADAGGDLEGR